MVNISAWSSCEHQQARFFPVNSTRTSATGSSYDHSMPELRSKLAMLFFDLVLLGNVPELHCSVG
ncbi:hypothetical protein [Nitrosomonas sp.]|uniref:hypothetical protein n=1 Tax=Nitrosomonas sp. TaxID=42353 RepID=UPI0026337B99|nr:hypothetical protein [Nitrosomonas sp.]